MIDNASSASGVPRLEDADDPPLHTERAWALDIEQQRQNYRLIIQAGNPHDSRNRPHTKARERIDVIDMPPDLRKQLMHAMRHGFEQSSHDHQHQLSQRLAEHTFVPWLMEELEEINGDAERLKKLLAMLDARMGDVPIAREHTWRQVATQLLESDEEQVTLPGRCTAQDVIAAKQHSQEMI